MNAKEACEWAAKKFDPNQQRDEKGRWTHSGTTATGSQFTLSGDIASTGVRVEIHHPSAGTITGAINPYVSAEQSTANFVGTVKGKQMNVKLPLDDATRNFLGKFHEESEEYRKNQISIHLGMTANDSAIEWTGDRRTPKEKIIEESAVLLKPHYKEEAIQREARESVEGYFKREEKLRQEEAETKKKRDEALDKAKRTGEPQVIGSRLKEGEHELRYVETLIHPDGHTTQRQKI